MDDDKKEKTITISSRDMVPGGVVFEKKHMEDYLKKLTGIEDKAEDKKNKAK